MVKYVPDKTGRFYHRPHYQPSELDLECNKILSDFYKKMNRPMSFPISTEDLTVLMEQHTSDFDPGADLSHYGEDVEGVTEFIPGSKPRVKISEKLAYDERRENRYRTTLTHEFGHVKFHGYLFEDGMKGPDLFAPPKKPEPQIQICKRDNILNAPQTDWMEWQAGYICGALLMPVAAIKNLVGEYQQQNNLFNGIAVASTHGQNLIQAVKVQFQVSEEAARVRLLALNLINYGQNNKALFG